MKNNKQMNNGKKPIKGLIKKNLTHKRSSQWKTKFFEWTVIKMTGEDRKGTLPSVFNKKKNVLNEKKYVWDAKNL